MATEEPRAEPPGTPVGSAAARRAQGAERDAGWAVHLRRLEEALARGHAGGMLREWQAACGAALATQQWEPMVAVGEAALRLGRATGFTLTFLGKTRHAYYVALFRAHRQGSPEGVLRVAEAFAAIDDRDAVGQCAIILERLAQRGGDAEAPGRLRALARDLAERLLAAGGPPLTAPETVARRP